jgi:hypothetical protein
MPILRSIDTQCTSLRLPSELVLFTAEFQHQAGCFDASCRARALVTRASTRCTTSCSCHRRCLVLNTLWCHRIVVLARAPRLWSLPA